MFCLCIKCRNVRDLSSVVNLSSSLKCVANHLLELVEFQEDVSQLLKKPHLDHYTEFHGAHMICVDEWYIQHALKGTVD